MKRTANFENAVLQFAGADDKASLSKHSAAGTGTTEQNEVKYDSILEVSEPTGQAKNTSSDLTYKGLAESVQTLNETCSKKSENEVLAAFTSQSFQDPINNQH